jgi:hypothetical protein
MRTLSIFLILLISIISKINCATYYVTANGTGNTCSQQSPCSITDINGFPLVNDDIIQIGCGVFSGLDVGIKVERFSINGDSSGCTIFHSSNCMILNGEITITNITFNDCSNSVYIKESIQNLTLQNVKLICKCFSFFFSSELYSFSFYSMNFYIFFNSPF